MKLLADIKETARYLGYKNTKLDTATLNTINECSEQLIACIKPKSIYRRFFCTVDKNSVSVKNIKFESKKLAEHLKTCSEMIVMAATLGIEADRLINRYSVTNTEKMLIMQAVGASVMESYCDIICNDIAKQLEPEKLFLHPRFSPGYGDFDISSQKPILAVLDATKRIGINLTNSYMMVPTKSVSAIVGISQNGFCNTDKCTLCDNVNCEFRKG